MSVPRPWGFWTQIKLDMLSAYLSQFTTASSGKAPHTIYLDLFAGQADNELRDTGGKIDGSLLRALSAHPKFTFVRGFELSTRRAQTLQAAYQDKFPSRDVRIYDGDVHDSIDRALGDLSRYCRAPTFAFVDPDGLNARWDLLERIAGFRVGKTKAEMFILFFSSAVRRVAHDNLTPDQLQHAEQVITDVFGCEDWRLILADRRNLVLDPETTLLQLTNLMRWRLENILGYKNTHTCRFTNVAGVPLYDMIFATDHPAGDRIMRSVYTNAVARFPEMRRQAQAARRDRRELETGALGFFSWAELSELGPLDLPEETYRHEPPLAPYGTAGNNRPHGAPRYRNPPAIG